MSSSLTFPFSLPGWRRLLLAMVCLPPALCFGTLDWAARRIELTAKPGDKEAVAVFRFVNTGTIPVTITAVRPDCGCTTAELDKETYAPGEAGEIKAVFTIGDRVGLQEKTIRVATDEVLSQPVPLMLRVNIPELLACSPRLLLWRTAEVIAEKSAIITAASPQKITAIEAPASMPPNVTSRIEAIEPGMKYRIAIRPSSVAKPANLALSYVARFADNTAHRFTVYVLIK